MQPEQDAFIEKLFREHFHELELYAYRFLRDKNAAQIATQDAFHIACNRIDIIMNSPNPVGWMKITTKNTALNMIKARNRQLKLFISIEEYTGVLATSDVGTDETELIDHCLTIVSAKEFELFRRIALDGIPYTDAAKELGISMWACRKRVQRITEKLRNALTAQ